MGQKIRQRIYTCSLCDKIPDDGENMWEMGSEVWCEKCIDKLENEQSP